MRAPDPSVRETFCQRRGWLTVEAGEALAMCHTPFILTGERLGIALHTWSLPLLHLMTTHLPQPAQPPSFLPAASCAPPAPEGVSKGGQGRG